MKRYNVKPKTRAVAFYSKAYVAKSEVSYNLDEKFLATRDTTFRFFSDNRFDQIVDDKLARFLEDLLHSPYVTLVDECYLFSITNDEEVWWLLVNKDDVEVEDV